jgi:hypothetical protein
LVVKNQPLYIVLCFAIGSTCFLQRYLAFQDMNRIRRR